VLTNYLLITHNARMGTNVACHMYDPASLRVGRWRRCRDGVIVKYLEVRLDEPLPQLSKDYASNEPPRRPERCGSQEGLSLKESCAYDRQKEKV
jgi:hypothetical protein